ncbi:c-type cytochrome [Stappia sp.]|uniref:c-type cytochrome n=1 Tax=Stappia sp. TaxID=1870903 RepID=UPI003D13A57E
MEVETMVTDERFMRRRRFRVRAFGALLAVCVSGAPVMAVDAGAGLELARTWCAACHLVEDGQARAGTAAAPFAEVAGDPAFDPERLAAFLAAPHPKMPDMSLTRREIADIGAYIAGLRR